MSRRTRFELGLDQHDTFLALLVGAIGTPIPIEPIVNVTHATHIDIPLPLSVKNPELPHFQLLWSNEFIASRFAEPRFQLLLGLLALLLNVLVILGEPSSVGIQGKEEGISLTTIRIIDIYHCCRMTYFYFVVHHQRAPLHFTVLGLFSWCYLHHVWKLRFFCPGLFAHSTLCFYFSGPSYFLWLL